MVNITADGCPVRDPRFPAEWPEHIVPVNVTLYVLNLVIVFVGSGLLLWYRKKPFLFERGYSLQMLAGLATLFQASVVFLRDAIGRDQFSCDAYLWISTLPAPLYCASIWIRMFVYHNKSTFAERRRAANVDQLHAEATERRRLTQMPAGSSNKLNESTRMLAKAANPSPLLTAVFKSVAGGVTGGMTRHGSIAAIRDIDLASAKALSGEGFGFLIIGVILIPFLAAIGVQYSTVSFYGNQCVGCILGFTETWIFLGAIIIIALMGIVMVLYWRLYSDPDPLWILHELVWATVITFILTITAIVIDVNNPARIHTNGTISWGYLVCFGLTIGFCIQTYYVVYHALKLDRARAVHARSLSMASAAHFNVTFDDVLNDPVSRTAFETHLTTEFSIENLKFFDKVTAWEKAFSSATEPERAAGAEAIYHTFLEPGVAPLEVNVSATQRDPIVKLFKLLPADRDLDQALFSQTKREIYKLMSTDSFNRFKGTSRYTALSGSVAARPSTAGINEEDHA